MKKKVKSKNPARRSLSVRFIQSFLQQQDILGVMLSLLSIRDMLNLSEVSKSTRNILLASVGWQRAWRGRMESHFKSSTALMLPVASYYSAYKNAYIKFASSYTSDSGGYSGPLKLNAFDFFPELGKEPFIQHFQYQPMRCSDVNKYFPLVKYQASLDLMYKAVVKAHDSSTRRSEFFKEGTTLLHWAAKLNQVSDVARLAGTAPGWIEREESDWFVPLYYAACYGHTAVVEKLIEAKANVDCEDEFGVTALCAAINRGHTAVVEKLIAAKALVSLSDDDEVTALHRAAKRKRLTVLNMLLAAGAQVNNTDRDGLTAMHMAVKSDWLDGLKVLIEAKGEVDVPTKKAGESVLDIALSHLPTLGDHEEVGSYEIVDVLLRHSGRFDSSRYPDKRTALTAGMFSKSDAPTLSASAVDRRRLAYN